MSGARCTGEPTSTRLARAVAELRDALPDLADDCPACNAPLDAIVGSYEDHLDECPFREVFEALEAVETRSGGTDR